MRFSLERKKWVGQEEGWNTGRRGPCLLAEFAKCTAGVLLVTWMEPHSDAQHHPVQLPVTVATRVGGSGSSQGAAASLLKAWILWSPPSRL